MSNTLQNKMYTIVSLLIINFKKLRKLSIEINRSINKMYESVLKFIPNTITESEIQELYYQDVFWSSKDVIVASIYIYFINR